MQGVSVVGGGITLKDLTVQNFNGEWAPSFLALRKRIINTVWANWIDGALPKSLRGDAPLDLKLHAATPMVAQPLGAYVQSTDDTLRSRSSANIEDVFDSAGGSLLVLGGQGSGKTTLLQALGLQLAKRAARAPDQHIPILFPMSAWEDDQELDQWLLYALHEFYGFPRQSAEQWIKADWILPLLDGLDEVNPSLRSQCARRIQEYRARGGMGGIVVSCQIDAYEELGLRLPFGGAIQIQPLQRTQVEEYLQRLDTGRASTWREVLACAPGLDELLDTPLWLSMLVAAPTPGAAFMDGSLEERRAYLLDAYLNDLFHRRRKLSKNARLRVERSLTWLAQNMRRRHLGAFAPRMLESGEDPNDMKASGWLPDDQRDRLETCVKATFRAGVALYMALTCAVGLGSSYALHLPIERLVFLSVGAALSALGVCGLLTLFSGIGNFLANAADLGPQQSRHIDAVGTSGVVWGVALLSGILGILPAALIAKSGWVGVGLGVGVVAGTVTGFVVALGFWTWQSAIPIVLGGGIALSWTGEWNWVQHAALGLLLGWVVGATGGLLGGLSVGEKNVQNRRLWGFGSQVRNFWIRVLLARTRCLPWNEEKFFRQARDVMLLRRVGKAHIFVHRTFLEHFASKTDWPDLTPTAGREAVWRRFLDSIS